MMETNPKELRNAIRIVGNGQPLEIIEAEILKQRRESKPKRRKSVKKRTENSDT